MTPADAQDGAPHTPAPRESVHGIPAPRESVHARLIAALQDQLTQPALITDARASGAEEVVLALEIGEERERLDLHLLLLAPAAIFWLEPAPRRHAATRAGFGHWLRRQVYGARISGVSAGRSGRILRLDLAAELTGETPPQALILDPLPNACRLLVLDAQGVVQQRYPPTIHGSPSGRGRPGEAYTEPEARPSEFWEREELRAKALPAEGVHPTREPPRAEKTRRAERTTGAESATRTDKAARTDKTARASGDALWLCIESLPPSAAGEMGRAVIFLSPHPCSTGTIRDAAQPPAGPLPPLEAAHRAGAHWRRLARHRLYARQLRQLLQREGRHLERLAKRLQRELSEAKEGTCLRRQAEALLAHGGRIPRGAERAVLDDPAAPGTKLEISLDPTLSFSQNATRLFRRAGRLERALPIRQKKQGQVETLRRHISAWRAGPELTDPAFPLREAVPPAHRRHGGADDLAAAPGRSDHMAYEQARALSKNLDPALRRRWQALLRDWQAIRESLLTPIDYVGYEARKHGTAARDAAGNALRPGGAPAAERGVLGAMAGIYPRRFELAGGWIVLVGRSNKENDVLTHRVARPNDLWLHARGVAGSHVVLRREGHRDKPPKSIIEEAARIAAYYSKGRTSSMVPVICTEKRYVRKPRRATPGLAVCMREKVLLVEPRLPEEGARGR